jgi:ACS family tartrate transporter-like MFS transporter
MRFLLGVTEAAFFPGVITYLNLWFCAQDRAKAVAQFMAAIPVSQLIAAPASAALMKVQWLHLAGWRWLLILEGAPALVCGLVSLRYLTDRPRDARWLAPEQRQWLVTELARESQQKSAARLSWVEGLRNPNVLLLCLVYFGGTTGNYGVSLWMPKMLQRLGHLSASTTSLLAAIPALAAVPAMLLFGWNSDRTGERRWHTAVPRFAGGIALAGVTMQAIHVPGALVLFSIAAAGIVAAYPPFWAIPNSFLGASATAASIGLISSLGNLGGLVGPSLIGWISTQTGSYFGGLWAVAAALFASGLFALMVRPAR